MTNKTDKELMEEFEIKFSWRLLCGCCEGRGCEHCEHEGDYNGSVLQWLKQALSRKEEEVKRIIRECLKEREKNCDCENSPCFCYSGSAMAMENIVKREIKNDLKSKGIEL